MKEYQKKTIQTYNAHAQAFQKSRAGFMNTKRVEEFVEKLSGKRILDVGCGPGRDSRYFVDQGYVVTGLDLSAELLRIAREAVPEAAFVEADMLAMPFDNDSFDGVWASASLLHLTHNDIVIALQEIYRVLVPGGVCYCSMKEGTGQREESDARLAGAERLFSFVTEADMISYMNTAGFEIISSHVVLHDNMRRPIDWVQLFVKKPV